MSSTPQKTHIYIDAFNLYYGCLKNTPYRWLNILSMCQSLLPNDNIGALKYFTARVSARPNDPNQPVRQQTYIRALGTIPNLEVIYGTFYEKTRWRPLANPAQGQNPYVEIIETTEKGSDVNLASHLLFDGFHNHYDIAVIISNDSDLLEPIRMVKDELNKPIGLINPQKHPSKRLLPHLTFIKQIRTGVLRISQFPQTLTDANGTFHKPSAW